MDKPPKESKGREEERKERKGKKRNDKEDGNKKKEEFDNKENCTMKARKGE